MIDTAVRGRQEHTNWRNPGRLVLTFGQSAMPEDKSSLAALKMTVFSNGGRPGITFERPQTRKEAITQRIATELTEQQRLQGIFDAALGIKSDPNDLLHRSYNVVSDRVTIERKRREGDTEGENAYIAEMRRNLATNLKERLTVSESKIHYAIKGDQLYSEHFPDKPFDEVLQKGIAHRLELNTPEPEREGELGELTGFKEIQKILTDPETKVGTTVTSFSPPGRVADTAYKGKFIDEFILKEGEQGRYVELTRFAVDFDDNGYRAAAIKLNPDYFKDYDEKERPLDAWLLSHPVEGSLSLLHEKGLAPVDFDRIFGNARLQRLIDHYVTSITAEHVDWHEVVLTFNAILNRADDEKQLILQQKESGVQVYPADKIHLSGSVHDDVRTLGMRPVKVVSGGGCPTNKGYSIGGMGEGSMNGNSVAQFAGESDSRGPLRFQCTCGAWHTREKDGQLIPKCDQCGARMCA